jgi:hypothetical protein
MRVPFGVIILAVLAVLAGVLEVIRGAQFRAVIAFGPVPAGNGNVILGTLGVIVGIAWIAIGLGFFTLKPWAWLVGMLLAIFGLFQALMTLLLTLSWEYAVVAAVLPAIVLVYLGRQKMKDAFGVLDQVS